MRVIKELEDGTEINVELYAVFVDEKEDGDDVTVLTILDDSGVVYCTNSDTFRRSFLEIADIYKEDNTPFTIIKISGTTKAGRPYVNCSLKINR